MHFAGADGQRTPSVLRHLDAGALSGHGLEKKWLLVFGLTDETFSIHCAAKEPAGGPGWFMLCVSLLDHSYWMLGSLIGCLRAGCLPLIQPALIFVMTALFVVIFLGSVEAAEKPRPGAGRPGGSALCLLAFGPDGFLLPAMALIVAGITPVPRQMGGKRMTTLQMELRWQLVRWPPY